ncbi:acetate--CoA ligase family protein [Hydrocarboniphaga sp.]|uniref:acetate--CoA ligase family protein n=1 Tax=Hydrocarboniphaga sp. TaxID=2033016 RepID=UPI002615F34D|nr:acetate--CoA ligase family protein [Hydrocarboniphaga sp.]
MSTDVLQARDRHPLERLFRPASIVLVGATERSLWSNMVFGNLTRFAFPGKIHLVNRNGGTVYERSAATSCVAIGEPIDLALVMVPGSAIDEVFSDLSEAGIANAVVLTSGFAELGADGALAQAALAKRAQQLGIRLLGPNCLGFINFIDHVPLFTSQRRAQREVGAVAIVSQSGAVGTILADVAFHQNVSLSYLVSTGNEVDVNVADVIDYLADEPHTKVIGVFLETVRDGQRFQQAALKARSAGKPIIVLKVGSSEISAKAARAHTGSLVGDDRVFDAACRRLGMVRVASPEELIATTAVLARLGRINGGFALAAMSGGMCEIAADRAANVALRMPALSEETVTALRQVMPAYGTPHNPLDFTGAAMLKPESIEAMLKVLASDPAVGVVACIFDAPEVEDRTGFVAKVFQSIDRGFSGTGKPVLILSNVSATVAKAGRDMTQGLRAPYFGVGVDRGLLAIANACDWWAHHPGVGRSSPPIARNAESTPAQRPGGEREVLDYLSSHGVPVIPAMIATSALQAEEIARKLGGSLAFKILSAQIAHKSDVGGVALNVTAETAAAVYDAMLEKVASARPDAIIDGVIVSPMRRGGVELFVGTMRDPVWGAVVAVGLGGVWVEALKDTSLRLLPVAEEDVLEMLGELRGTMLLSGFRGAPAVDRRALAQSIVRIGDAALALGPDLISLEVNPLLATHHGVEALDGLVVWT